MRLQKKGFLTVIHHALYGRAVYNDLLDISVSVGSVKLTMGCIFCREENKISKVQTSSFYVETKLDPVPKWAERDWETLLWRNNMTSDQDNIDQATEKLKDDEKILQNNRDNFDEIMSDMNGQMSERRISLKNNQDILKDEVDRFIQMKLTSGRELTKWRKFG